MYGKKSLKLDPHDIDDDREIRAAKERLRELEKQRARKNADLSRHNVELIQRDEARDKLFRETYLTPEALAEIERQKEIARLAALLKDLEFFEETAARILYEEEENLEHKVLMYDHGLSLHCREVMKSFAEVEKQQRSTQLRAEEWRRKNTIYESMKSGVRMEAEAARNTIFRNEAAERKAIVQKWKPALNDARERESSRVTTEVQDAIESERAAIAAEEAAKDAVVDEAMAAYEAQMQRVAYGFRGIKRQLTKGVRCTSQAALTRAKTGLDDPDDEKGNDDAATEKKSVKGGGGGEKDEGQPQDRRDSGSSSSGAARDTIGAYAELPVTQSLAFDSQGTTPNVSPTACGSGVAALRVRRRRSSDSTAASSATELPPKH